MALKAHFAWNLPHASEKLDKATITKGQRHNNIRLLDATSLCVDARKHESSQSESAETKGSRVGKFSVLVGFPQSWVQRAASGSRKTSVDSRDVMVIEITGMNTIGTIDTIRLLFDGGGSRRDLSVLGGHCDDKIPKLHREALSWYNTVGTNGAAAQIQNRAELN